MVEYPTPTRPWRGIPERKPTAIGISFASSCASNAARSATFRVRALEAATSFEAATRLVRSVTALHDRKDGCEHGHRFPMRTPARMMRTARDGRWVLRPPGSDDDTEPYGAEDTRRRR